MTRHRGVGLATIMMAMALVLAACGSSSPSSSKASSSRSGGTVTEAAVIAYTGTNAFEGGVTDAGLYPAAYEINKAGGILGKRLTILPVDTRGDPADALPLMEKMLATTHNLLGISGLGTESGPTLIPVANSAHVVSTISAGEATYDRMTYPYIWRLLPPDPVNGEAMALWARHLGYTRIATVFGTNASAQGDLPGVLAGIKAIHAKLVLNLGLTPDQPSYRTDVERLIAARPQVIMTESDGPTAATFFGELKQLGKLVPIIGTSGTAVSSWIGPLRSAIGVSDFEHYVTIVNAASPKPTPAFTAYVDGLHHSASKVPHPVNQWESNSYAQAFYDQVIMQALAADAAHSTKGSVYDKYIEKVTEPGPGKTIVYSYAQGKKALAEGKQIEYVGASGRIVFDKYHNSFGNEVAERIPVTGRAIILGVITEKSIQALG